MDIVKVQTDILKKLIKGKLKTFMFAYKSEDIWISTNGYSAYKIPNYKDNFFVDIEKKFTEANAFKDRIDDAFNSSTPVDRVTRADMNSAVIDDILILTSDLLGTTTYVDYKLIKPFESKKSKLSFTMSTPLSAVLVYEDGKLVGVVLPFRCANTNTITNERDYYVE